MDSSFPLTQTTTSLEPIRHAQTAWAVAAMIEPAPGAMMMRELVKNALEAAERTATATARGKVVFDAVEVQGASGPIAKLRVKNTGPGMDAAELRAVMDLHSSGGGKINGLNDNFGVGAKVTGLKNNPAGMRYRSCKGGLVSEAIICRHAGDYGLLKQQDGSGGHAVIVDRTSDSIAAGVDLRTDWTEVVLYGEDLEHDTTAEPLKKGRPLSSNWIAAAVNNRFYSLPAYVDVEIDISLDRGKHPQRRILRGASSTVRGSAAKGQHAVVELGNGVTAEFAVLGKEGQNRYALTGQSGLVFRGEIYDFTAGSNEWARRAARFGITYGATQVVVFVHLPDDAKLTPDKYRQRLEKDEPDRPAAIADDYASQIAKNLPDFVRKHVESSKPRSLEDSKTLQERLKRLAIEYDWRRGVFKHDASGTELCGGNNTRGDAEGGKRGGGGTGTRTITPGSNTSRPSGGTKRGVLPKIDWIDGGVRRSEGELAGRAASYDPTIHALRLNLNYEGLDAAVKALVARWPSATDPASLQHEAMIACQEEYTVRACKAVMHAFMHESDRAWSRESIIAALSDYALTIHLDDVKEVAERTVGQLRKKWGAPI